MPAPIYNVPEIVIQNDMPERPKQQPNKRSPRVKMPKISIKGMKEEELFPDPGLYSLHRSSVETKRPRVVNSSHDMVPKSIVNKALFRNSNPSKFKPRKPNLDPKGFITGRNFNLRTLNPLN